MTKFDNGVCDEFGCFNILDFQAGDHIATTVRDPNNLRKRVRIKGTVVSVMRRPPVITFLDVSGQERTAKLNDITYLSSPEKGWLER